MKNKRLIVLLVAGMLLIIIGLIFKAMHWEGYKFLLITGMLAAVVALAKLVYRSLTKTYKTR